MFPRVLTLLAVCAALAAALPVDQYGGDTWEESQQTYAEPVDERQERAAAPGEEDDLGQETQQYQQSDDLGQETQQSDDLTQETQQYQQSDDLTQETQQSDDLTQETQQSDDLTQETQQSDDLTQETQQSDDLTQETQQSDDLTQETQQSDDLSQETQQYQQSDDFPQETQQSDDISQYSQQSQQDQQSTGFQDPQSPSWSRKPPQRPDEGIGRTSGRLTDSRNNTGDNTRGNNWNSGSNGNNWNSGSNGNNWNTDSNGSNGNTDRNVNNGNTGGNGNNGAGDTGNSWGNSGSTNTDGSFPAPTGSEPVDRPARPLTPPPDYIKLPRNAQRPLGHYKVYTTPKIWVEAVMVCAADAAELAIGRNLQEALEIGTLYKEAKKNVKGSADKELFFVGASDLAKENDFVTLSGQHFQDGFFTRWQKGEPNNHKKNEHCVLSNELAHYWDGNCNSKFAFVCRFKPDPCERAAALS